VKFCKRLVINTLLKVSVLFIILSLGACRLPFSSFSHEPGSLALGVDSGKSVSVVSLEPSSYIFSGAGPDNDSFYIELSDSSTTVEGLNTGEWTVRVDGLDGNGTVLLTGEAVLNVAPYVETQVNIVLHPLEGTGSVSLSLEWNELQTVDPSAVVNFLDLEGNETSQQFIISNPGLGTCNVSGLPTGNYYVTVQLFDSGVLAMGSAWTVRVLDSITVEVSALFEDLNKVGERMEITEDSFIIAWDPDPSSGIPDAYRVYFRSRGDEPWSFLSETAPEPEFTVTEDNLSLGIYEFAVSAVADGVESDLHSSMDDTANPGTGWFVDWHLL